MKWVKDIYDWVIHWAKTPYAIPALIILAFAESSFFPIPPDVLLIAMALSLPKKSFKFAFYAAIASVVGGMVGYAIGHFFYEAIGQPIVSAYNGEATMEKIKSWYDAYGFFGILVAAITPIPYKVFTIASGVFSFDFSSFLTASIIGRSIRFFAVAGLIWKFGEPITKFIDKYFNWLMIAFVVLLMGGFLILGKGI
ncbi:MAG: DedA family protein [Calditrichia bacterium]|nr:DedA family protein [Calditrichia bacterium]